MEIEGFENYIIFENGDVINKNTGKKLKPHKNYQTGYFYIDLYKKMNRKKFTLHRLLAQAYIPNPFNKTQVDHINRIRDDNRLENLRWSTHSENNVNKDGYKINKLKTKYIHKARNKFRITFNRNTLTYSKHAIKTLEEAIIQRDLMLSMFTN